MPAVNAAAVSTASLQAPSQIKGAINNAGRGTETLQSPASSIQRGQDTFTISAAASQAAAASKAGDDY